MTGRHRSVILKKCNCTGLNAQTKKLTVMHRGAPLVCCRNHVQVPKLIHSSLGNLRLILSLLAREPRSIVYVWLISYWERSNMCQHVTKECACSLCVALISCPFIASQINNLHKPVLLLCCLFSLLPSYLSLHYECTVPFSFFFYFAVFAFCRIPPHFLQMWL